MNAELVIGLFALIMVLAMIGFSMFMKSLMDDTFGGIKRSLDEIKTLAESKKKTIISRVLTLNSLIKYATNLKY